MTNTEKEVLLQIKQNLKHGDIKQIAERAKKTREYTAHCLNPKNDTYNEPIVQAALDHIREREEKVKNDLSQLKAISNEQATSN